MTHRIEELKNKLNQERRLRAKETNALLIRLSNATPLLMQVLYGEDVVIPVDLAEAIDKWINETADDLTEDLKNTYEENHQLKDRIQELENEKAELTQELMRWERSSDKHY